MARPASRRARAPKAVNVPPSPNAALMRTGKRPSRVSPRRPRPAAAPAAGNGMPRTSAGRSSRDPARKAVSVPHPSSVGETVSTRAPTASRPKTSRPTRTAQLPAVHPPLPPILSRRQQNALTLRGIPAVRRPGRAPRRPNGTVVVPTQARSARAVNGRRLWGSTADSPGFSSRATAVRNAVVPIRTDPLLTSAT